MRATRMKNKQYGRPPLSPGSSLWALSCHRIPCFRAPAGLNDSAHVSANSGGYQRFDHSERQRNGPVRELQREHLRCGAQVCLGEGGTGRGPLERLIVSWKQPHQVDRRLWSVPTCECVLWWTAEPSQGPRLGISRWGNVIRSICVQDFPFMWCHELCLKCLFGINTEIQCLKFFKSTPAALHLSPGWS